MASDELRSRALQDLKQEQILVRMTAKQKNAICRASEATDVAPSTLIRTITCKFLEDAGYLEKPETWDLRELSDFLKATRNEAPCKEKG